MCLHTVIPTNLYNLLLLYTTKLVGYLVQIVTANMHFILSSVTLLHKLSTVSMYGSMYGSMVVCMVVYMVVCMEV